jgi:hypothetical protein
VETAGSRFGVITSARMVGEMGGRVRTQSQSHPVYPQPDRRKGVIACYNKSGETVNDFASYLNYMSSKTSRNKGRYYTGVSLEPEVSA